MGSKWTKYTPDQAEFLVRMIPDNPFKVVVDEFNKKFEREITLSQVRAYAKNHKLRTGRDTRFKPGHIPCNKGKKQTEFMTSEAIEKTKATRFKKGQRSINWRPVGSTRITKDGYIEIKVKDPNIWKLMHRVVWEKENGPLKKNEAIMFLDGNKTNCELSNLKKIKRKDLVRYNHRGIRYDNPALTDAYMNVIQLENYTREAEKNGRKSDGKINRIC